MNWDRSAEARTGEIIGHSYRGLRIRGRVSESESVKGGCPRAKTELGAAERRAGDADADGQRPSGQRKK